MYLVVTYIVTHVHLQMCVFSNELPRTTLTSLLETLIEGPQGPLHDSL